MLRSVTVSDDTGELVQHKQKLLTVACRVWVNWVQARVWSLLACGDPDRSCWVRWLMSRGKCDLSHADVRQNESTATVDFFVCLSSLWYGSFKTLRYAVCRKIGWATVWSGGRATAAGNGELTLGGVTHLRVVWDTARSSGCILLSLTSSTIC